MIKQTNEKGFAHVQIALIIVAVVLVSSLTLWRVTKNSSIKPAGSPGSDISQEEVAALASDAKFIDEDHDLIPQCTDVITVECEDKTDDQDYDNDGVKDSEDDSVNGENKSQSSDDSDHDKTDDSDDADDDNDSVNDDSDPDDDNDGQEDNEDSHADEDSHDDEDKKGSDNEDTHVDEDKKADEDN